MNKGMMWGLVIVAFLVGGFSGFTFERSRTTVKMEAMRIVMQRQIDEAKKMSEKESVMGAKSTMDNEQEKIMMMATNDKSSLKATLTDVTGGTSTGTAYVLRKDGKLTFTVTAHVPDPENGTFYEGWLVKADANPVQYEDTGKLTKQKDGSYEVSYSSDEIYEGYNMVVVTLEKVDDQKPEKHILEGTAK